VESDIGWELWKTEGNPLSDRTIALLEKHKIGLFGAITSMPKDAAAAEPDPALKDKGVIYSSPTTERHHDPPSFPLIKALFPSKV
jgi:3-isopropylmalate dehydrogenase